MKKHVEILAKKEEEKKKNVPVNLACECDKWSHKGDGMVVDSVGQV